MGGSGDGSSLTNISQGNNEMVYNGGVGDGFGINGLNQGNNTTLFLGGMGQGYVSDGLIQGNNAQVYNGGIGDGFAAENTNQGLNTVVYIGGEGDGHNTMGINQGNNLTVYKGGGGDGWMEIFYAEPTVTLPLKLLSFTAIPKDNFVQISWQTSQESQMASYIVERSSNTKIFEAIASILPQNIQSKQNYQWLDNSAFNATQYYRLKMIEQNGQYQYSKIVAVNPITKDVLTVFPNPSQDVLYINWGNNKEIINLQITSITGQIYLSQKNVKPSLAGVKIQNLPAATYFLQLSNGQKTETIKFIKTNQ